MSTDNLYEDFFKPLQPSATPPTPTHTPVDRDELGLMKPARNRLERLLSTTHEDDLVRVYPELSSAIKMLKSATGIKRICECTFSEFWEQQGIGEIREQDQKFFQLYIKMWSGMTTGQRIKVLGNWKAAYSRGMYFTIILNDAIDPYWRERKQEESGGWESGDGDPNT